MIDLLMGAGAIIAGLLAMVFWKDKKIGNLEQENKGQSKKIKTQKAMKKAEIKAEAKEDEAIKDFDDSDWHDNI